MKRNALTGTINCQPGEWQSNPIVVIDGLNISWDRFAQTVLIYECFKFKLEFIDPTA